MGFKERRVQIHLCLPEGETCLADAAVSNDYDLECLLLAVGESSAAWGEGAGLRGTSAHLASVALNKERKNHIHIYIVQQ